MRDKKVLLRAGRDIIESAKFEDAGIVIDSGSEAPTSLRAYGLTTWILLAALLLAGTLYGGYYLKRGWIPHDAGAYALDAERALHGELPNRDFTDLYTGGLTELNGLAMRIFGVNLAAIRYPLFALFLAWIPAVFNIARRFVSDAAATLVTILAIAVSLPNYSAAVPSWYTVFLATFVVLAIYRFIETDKRHWLAVAGVCAGLSFLVKIAGLYCLAAVLLLLLFREQEVDRLPGDRRSSLDTFDIVAVAASVLFVLLLLKLINWNPSARYSVHFVLPGAALAGLLVWREFSAGYAPVGRRFARLFGDALPLLVGFVAPILLFLIPYFTSGSLSPWFNAVFVLPTKRLAFASRSPASLNPLATLLLIAGLIAARNWRKPLGSAARIVIAVALTSIVVESGTHKFAYHLLWYALVLMIPGITLVAVLWRELDARAFALVAMTALCSLIQYPFAAPIYLVYVLPLAALATAALIAGNPRYSRFLAACIALTYLAFFVLRVTPSYVYAMGVMNTGNQQTYTLQLPRARGIRVEPRQGATYERVVALIEEHRKGEYIYAVPDAPELYFFSASKSPTKAAFDFLDEASKDPVVELLSQYDIHVVVIKTPERNEQSKAAVPGFSAMDPALLATLRAVYPQSEVVSNFEVRWK